jgi:hypothetical protein
MIINHTEIGLGNKQIKWGIYTFEVHEAEE